IRARRFLLASCDISIPAPPFIIAKNLTMIATTTSKITYAGNESTSTAYPFSFPLAAASHLIAIETEADGTETTLSPGDYTVTPTTDLHGRITGGGVTTDPAIPATSELTLKRVTPKTQTLDLVQGARFSAEAVESALDRITMISQEIHRDF